MDLELFKTGFVLLGQRLDLSAVQSPYSLGQMGLRRTRRKHLLSEPLVFSCGSKPRAICLYAEPICCSLVNIGSQHSLSPFLTLE